MNRKQKVLALAVALALAVPIVAQDTVASKPPTVRGAELVDRISPFVFDGDLRSLPTADGWRVGDPIKEIPRRHYGDVSEMPTAPKHDPDPLLGLQETAPAARAGEFTEPVQRFAGQGYSGVQPPDPIGDVGVDYYIQAINRSSGASFVVYDKSDNSVVAGPTYMDSLGSGNCASGLGDPVVLYDHLAGRWMLSEFSSSGNRLCVYISQTGDPVTGGWYNYDFTAPNFPDYPKYAVWPDAYYVTSNESGGPAVYALERSQMLSGLTADMQRFTAPSLAGFGFQTLTPAELDGPAPPAGSVAYMVRHRDDEAHNPGSNDPTEDYLELFEFDVDWATPGNSTFTGPTAIAIAEIDSHLCGYYTFSCMPQPGTSTRIDPLREPVMWRTVYRNFGSYEVLAGSLVTDVDATDHAGVRWFELRRSGGAWSLHQEGTYAIDSDNRFMSSPAMDGDGNFAVGYNVSSSATYPSLRYAGRYASDPLGTLPQGENSFVAGAGSNTSYRYGDYNSLNVDPVDDCTFWFTGEYNPSSQWATWISSFQFAGCGQQDVCEIDLVTNTHTCDGVSAVDFVLTPTGGRTVLKVNLDPNDSGFRRAIFEVTYGAAPTGLNVNIGDSSSNNGYAGDGGDQSNDAETQVAGTTLTVYGKDGTPSQPLTQVTGIAGAGTLLSIDVSDEQVRWHNYSGEADTYTSSYLYALDGQADSEGPVNYDIYAGFNRSIGSSWRTGTGVSKVRIRLFAESEVCELNLVNNTHTCSGVSEIGFVQSPSGGETVLSADLDPVWSDYTKAHFDVYYGSTPTDWTVNIGDSSSNNGYGGDYSTQSNDAEMQVHGTALGVYGKDGTPSQPLASMSGVAALDTFLTLEIGDERLDWDNRDGEADTLISPYLYALDGQPDSEGPVNYEIFAGFNRTVGSSYRDGTGVSYVTVILEE